MRKSRLGMLKVKAEENKKNAKNERTYTDLVKNRELSIAEGVKLVFSVSKANDGNPHIDIRTHITSEKYTGMTKKGINFDIEFLEEFKQIIEFIDEELQENGI